MTVKELIKKLKEMPQDMEVRYEAEGEDYEVEYVNETKITSYNRKWEKTTKQYVLIY